MISLKRISVLAFGRPSRRSRAPQPARSGEAGYTLLFAVFLAASMLIMLSIVSLKITTQGQREAEEEMVWRGHQYERGIRRYVQKFGHYPTKIDDMVKATSGVRYMREAYKDPMNKEDGSWRLIYVGPAGQLIGSLNPSARNVQMPTAAGQPGATPGNATTSTGGQAGALGGFGRTSSTPGAPAANGPGTTGSPPGTAAQGTDTTGTGTDPQAVPTGDTPTIVGGSIIGIGSKINQPSIIVFEKAHNYRLFEFIWDPSKDLGIAGAPVQQIGIPGVGAPGTQPPQQNPLNPPPSPPTAVPNPNPTQQ